MRSIWLGLCVFLAGCATRPLDASEAVRGCWIDHETRGAITFRWLPDFERPGTLRGEQTSYFIDDAESVTSRSWRLKGNRMCAVDDAGQVGRCWPVTMVAGHGDRIEISAAPETLKMTLYDRGAARILYDGARDGCD